MSDSDENPQDEGGQAPPPPRGDSAADAREGSVADAVNEAFAESATDWAALATERTADLQRLQAEYVNYKRRVDRDRSLARQAGIENVVSDLMPVLDSISLAREHNDLTGGFKMVADELEKVAAKHGLTSFGAVGEAFDPNRHDALMEIPMDGDVTVTTISQVMQQGYALGDRIIRPARVGVANPAA